IQKEIGDAEGKDEFADIEDKIKKTKLSKEAREKATHEPKKLRQMPPMSTESTVVRNYLDWLLSIPRAIDDEALLTIIRRYTREAGVCNLERELSTLIRKAVKELLLSEKKSVKASADNLADYLGVPKYRYGEVEDEDQIGIVTRLAWTDVGGELLTIEAAMMPGKGRMTVTGNLRDVMKESISAAASYVACARSPSASSRPCLTSATSTCTCRKARPRRTDPPPESPWPPRSSR